MHILLIYPGGREQDGLLLAGTQERMRVMMPGRADAVEFRLIAGTWMGESGASVEIGAIVGSATPSADRLSNGSSSLRAGSHRNWLHHTAN